jgi:uncharacterized protein (TIGR00375 family)
MKLVIDLHLHSRFSRAVSPQMNLENLEKTALQKGIHLLSLSDFTHPMWFREISEKVEETENGVYQLKSRGEHSVKFLVTTEISCIYKQGGTLRRIHLIVCLSSLQKASYLTQELLKRGANLSADGRPIIGMSAKNLLAICLEIDPQTMMIPAHIWTPHFGVYGSASGFDSLEDCFEDLAPYIYGIETGISSDPEMNWQIPELRTRSILSFSDAHSLPKMAREATVLVGDKKNYTYEDILQAIQKKEGALKVDSTIEFYPEEGKYHFSGHRKCKVSYGLEDVRMKGTLCPVCGRKLTEGVYIRLQQLAPHFDTTRMLKKTDKHGMTWYTDKENINPSFVKLIPLKEIIAESFRVGIGSKKVEEMFEIMTKSLGTELEILMEKDLTEIEKVSNERVAEGVLKNRKGELSIIPGFDGEYGKVSLWEEHEIEHVTPQLSLEF